MEGYIPTIYEKYEQISAQPDEEEEIANIMPHFLFYRRIKNDVDFYCTACHNRYFRPKSDFVGGSAALSHKEQGLCPVCGEAVQFRCMSYGRRTLDRWENFVLVRPEREDHVFLECCGVRLHFEDDDMEPKYDLFLKASYELSPGSVARYVWRWHWYGGYDWVEVKNIKEPHFVTLPYGWEDNTYTVIGEDKLDGTFLKYAMTADVPSEWLFVTYLCKYAVHPNIEYLMKGGFVDIVTELCKGRSGIRVNWKSNDLKKMLRLNRTELNLLKELSAGDYRSYITIRKHLPGVCKEKLKKAQDELAREKASAQAALDKQAVEHRSETDKLTAEKAELEKQLAVKPKEIRVTVDEDKVTFKIKLSTAYEALMPAAQFAARSGSEEFKSKLRALLDAAGKIVEGAPA